MNSRKKKKHGVNIPIYDPDEKEGESKKKASQPVGGGEKGKTAFNLFCGVQEGEGICPLARKEKKRTSTHSSMLLWGKKKGAKMHIAIVKKRKRGGGGERRSL